MAASSVRLPVFNGTLGAEHIRMLIAEQALTSDSGITEDQIQPASLDLTVASEAYRMPGSLLPRTSESLRDLINDLSIERVNLSGPTCLARGQSYLIRLREKCALPQGLEAYTNSKSSTGRIDLATRVLSDGNPRYDRIRSGYQGDLWIEVIPRSFDVVIQAGDSLNQAIFFQNRDILSHQQLIELHSNSPLLFSPNGTPIKAADCIHDDHLGMTADLSADIVGFQAKRTHKPLELRHIGKHDPEDYFTPVHRPKSGILYLQKDCFYI